MLLLPRALAYVGFGFGGNPIGCIIRAMREDHIKRQMEFIVEHQARFASDIEEVKAIQKRNAEQIEANSKQIEANAERIAELTEDVAVLYRSITALAETVHAQSADMARTDERLNVLMNIVERHISETHKA
jgi:hypothetical protein